MKDQKREIRHPDDIAESLYIGKVNYSLSTPVTLVDRKWILEEYTKVFKLLEELEKELEYRSTPEWEDD